MMTATDLSQWTPRPRPERKTFEGRYVRIEPLSAARHGDGLFAASTTTDAETRFRWLPDTPPETRAAFQPWLESKEASTDPLFFTVFDRASGSIAGRQTFLRIDANNGVIEIGNILWNAPIARRPGATEALYLFAAYAFDALGYRRFEWKCDSDNAPSRRAAERFGFTFEGIFREHMVVKGRNRDTAWFAMIDKDWPVVGAALRQWLEAANFDGEGRQKRRLEEIRASLG